MRRSARSSSLLFSKLIARVTTAGVLLKDHRDTVSRIVRGRTYHRSTFPHSVRAGTCHEIERRIALVVQNCTLQAPHLHRPHCCFPAAVRPPRLRRAAPWVHGRRVGRRLQRVLGLEGRRGLVREDTAGHERAQNKKLRVATTTRPRRKQSRQRRRQVHTDRDGRALFQQPEIYFIYCSSLATVNRDACPCWNNHIGPSYNVLCAEGTGAQHATRSTLRVRDTSALHFLFAGTCISHWALGWEWSRFVVWRQQSFNFDRQARQPTRLDCASCAKTQRTGDSLPGAGCVSSYRIGR